MVYQGHVKNGVIHLDASAILPEGAKVNVQLMPAEADSRSAASLENELAGIWADVPKTEWNRLPSDLTDKIDHYVYGIPK